MQNPSTTTARFPKNGGHQQGCHKRHAVVVRHCVPRMKARSRMTEYKKPWRNHKGPNYTGEQSQLFNEVYHPRTSKSKYSGSNQRHAEKQENMTYGWKKNESIGTDPGITRTRIGTDDKAVMRTIFKDILKHVRKTLNDEESFKELFKDPNAASREKNSKISTIIKIFSGMSAIVYTI